MSNSLLKGLPVITQLVLLAQPMDIRIDANEVAVPFRILDYRGRQLPYCPKSQELKVKDQGVPTVVTSVFRAARAPEHRVALDIAVSLGGIDQALRRSVLRATLNFVTSSLKDGDECGIHLAQRIEPDRASEYQSNLYRTKKGCIDYLQFRLNEIRGAGEFDVMFTAIDGPLPDVALAGRAALKAVRRVALPDKAVIFIGTGESDQPPARSWAKGMQDAFRKARERVFVLHFNPFRPDQITAEGRSRQSRLDVPPLEATEFQLTAMGSQESVFRELADVSGGRYFSVTESNVSEAWNEVLDEVSGYCLLTFRPSSRFAGTGEHSIEITAPSLEGWRLVHRRTYDPGVKKQRE